MPYPCSCAAAPAAVRLREIYVLGDGLAARRGRSSPTYVTRGPPGLCAHDIDARQRLEKASQRSACGCGRDQRAARHRHAPVDYGQSESAPPRRGGLSDPGYDAWRSATRRCVRPVCVRRVRSRSTRAGSNPASSSPHWSCFQGSGRRGLTRRVSLAPRATAAAREGSPLRRVRNRTSPSQIVASQIVGLARADPERGGGQRFGPGLPRRREGRDHGMRADLPAPARRQARVGGARRVAAAGAHRAKAVPLGHDDDQPPIERGRSPRWAENYAGDRRAMQPSTGQMMALAGVRVLCAAAQRLDH